MKHDRSETTVVNKKTTGMVGARAQSSGVETRGGRRKRNASMLSWFPRLNACRVSVKRMRRRNSSLGKEEGERERKKNRRKRKSEKS